MTKQEALLLAFELALSAPTKEFQNKAGELARSLARTMPNDDVEKCMERFVQVKESTES